MPGNVIGRHQYSRTANTEKEETGGTLNQWLRATDVLAFTMGIQDLDTRVMHW